MKRKVMWIIIALMLMATTASAQENLQRGAIASQVKKSFTTVKELPITSVKNQYRSGTCWAYATLGYFESEILRQTGKTYDLCEMFVVNNDYMDNATHYVQSVLPRVGTYCKQYRKKNAKAPKAHWQDSVQAVINRYMAAVLSSSYIRKKRTRQKHLLRVLV